MHKQMSDGHLNKCKECTKRDVKAHRLNNPGADLDARIAANEKSPDTYHARRVVEAAINAGVLVKPECCSGCGRSASDTRISAHHHDYRKPLDVVWVCAKCHRQLDANRRELEGKSRFGNERHVVMIDGGMAVCRFDSITDAARCVGVKPNSISQCLSGVSKTCAGFEWAYEEVV